MLWHGADDSPKSLPVEGLRPANAAVTAQREWMAAGTDAWELSERVFECFLMDRAIQDTDMVLPTFFDPNLRRTPWLDRLQLGQNVIPIGN